MKIHLSPYDPAWAVAFRGIESRLRAALGQDALAIEHVGSTAVPGLAAKPIIDVVLAVADSAAESSYADRLLRAGFVFHLREPEWHEHRLFKRTAPMTNIHVFSQGCSEIARMLRFRDLLRRDADARTRYESTKRDLARREWGTVQDYADAKTDVVELLLRSAMTSHGPSRPEGEPG